jgi:uncharacterized protein YegP (UPF0339 family)
MAGTFEIYKDKKGEYRYRLKSGNGEIILSGEGYEDKAGAENGIESVRTNSQDEGRYELAGKAEKEFRFNLKAPNGRVIGVSEAYSTEEARKTGMVSVKKNAPDASVRLLD